MGNFNKNFDEIVKVIKEYKYQIILFIILGIILFLGYEYYSKYMNIFRDPKKIKEFVYSYGNFSVVVFLLLQIIQVIVFFIPGEFVQIAGGYIYGTFLGSILSIIGISIGNIIIYLIARKFGKPFVRKVISEKDLKFFDKILSYGDINYIVFLLYLIPGIPKDALGYICGISEIKNKDFYIYSTIGRLPGIIISSYFGNNIVQRNKPILIFIGVTMSLIFIVGLIKGEKIIKSITKVKE